jgi:hypothetical protein
MKTSTLIALLTRATKALALVGSLVIFGFIYVLAVQPHREAAEAARQQLAALREDLIRQRGLTRSLPTLTQPSAKREFEIRTSEEDPTSAAVEAIVSLANSPSVGGVTNLSVETAVAIEGPIDPRIALFRQSVVYAPISVIFDASYDRIGRFFWNLRTLPSTFELRSVELTPVPAKALIRARLVLFVFQRVTLNQPAQGRSSNLQVIDVKTAPRWSRDPFHAEPDAIEALSAAPAPPPEPKVFSILISGQRRIALIDGRIVRVGDRVGSSLVRAIDQDSVLLVTVAGNTQRLTLDRPQIRRLQTSSAASASRETNVSRVKR